jgi:hypothetical protein
MVPEAGFEPALTTVYLGGSMESSIHTNSFWAIASTSWATQALKLDINNLKATASVCSSNQISSVNGTSCLYDIMGM